MTMPPSTGKGDALIEVTLVARHWATLLRVLGNALGAGPVEIDPEKLIDAGAALQTELMWKMPDSEGGTSL